MINHGEERFAFVALLMEGKVRFVDKNNVVYIRPKSVVEMDYNVFYRYKIKEK